MPSCLRLLAHRIRLAASRTFWTAGSSRPMSTAMMAITTSSSISVKARRVRGTRDMGDPRAEKAPTLLTRQGRAVNEKAGRLQQRPAPLHLLAQLGEVRPQLLRAHAAGAGGAAPPGRAVA